MKNIFTILLALLLVSGLSGCQSAFEGQSSPPAPESSSVSSAGSSSVSPSAVPGQKMSAEELKTLLEDLMPKSDEIHGIYSGGGLQTDAEADLPAPDENEQQFVPVTDDRFHSVQDLTEYTESVYTKEYAQENFYQYALEGPYIRYREQGGELWMDLAQGGGGGWIWNIATAEISSQEGDFLVVSMECMDYYDGKYDGAVTLKNTPDGWRIDTLETRDPAAG